MAVHYYYINPKCISNRKPCTQHTYTCILIYTVVYTHIYITHTTNNRSHPALYGSDASGNSLKNKLNNNNPKFNMFNSVSVITILYVVKLS